MTLDDALVQSADTAITPDAARERTAQLRAVIVRGIEAVAEVQAAVEAAFRDGVWRALGYATWQSYCDGELSTERLALSADDRRAAIEAGIRAGLAGSVLAAAYGVDRRTVDRQRRGLAAAGGHERDALPARAVGADGKMRPTSRTTSATTLERARKAAEFKRAGLRQSDIALRLKVSQPTVSALLGKAREQGWVTAPAPQETQVQPTAAADEKRILDPGASPDDVRAQVEARWGDSPLIDPGATAAQGDPDSYRMSSAAVILADVAERAFELPALAAWVWDRITEPDWDSDRWYAADLQELLGKAVGEAVVTIIRAAQRLGLDVKATLASGDAVWATDRRPVAAAERAVWGLFETMRQQGGAPVPVPALTRATGVPADRVRDVIRDAKLMARVRWVPTHGIAPAALAAGEVPTATQDAQ